MIWFSSDHHLGNRAIITLQNRPFQDVEDMNRTIIVNHNSLVRPSDTVYLTGDLTNRIPVEEANELISKLNGKKILIRGNHDKNYDPSLFEAIYDFKTIKLDGIKVSLMHYSMMTWPSMRHGAIHLHGHLHSPSEYNEDNRRNGIRRYDVGVEANGYCPVSWEQIKQFFGILT